jgi:hypothetical protein
MSEDPIREADKKVSPATNHRGMLRRPAKGVVLLRLDKWGMGRGIACRVLEVNEAGVSFVSPEQVAMGAEVEVELSGLVSRSGKRVASTIRHIDATEDGIIVGCEFERRIKLADYLHMLR